MPVDLSWAAVLFIIFRFHELETHRVQAVAIAAALATAVLVTQARAAEVSGVKLEDRATVAGTPLVLNGAGVRYKGPFKV